VFPDAEIKEVGGMVPSLKDEDQVELDGVTGTMPIRLCPRHFGWVRRPRLHWSKAKIVKGDGAHVEVKRRYAEVQLTGKRTGISMWLPRKWKLRIPSVCVPTFVRGTRKKKPPFLPAGLSTLTAEKKKRYIADEYAVPPYQYKACYTLLDSNRKIVLPNSAIREVFMGYPQDCTFAYWSSQQRRDDPCGHESARSSLIRNGFHAGAMPWVMGLQLYEWDLIRRMPTVEEVADPGKQFSLAFGSNREKFNVNQELVELSEGDEAVALARWLMGLNSYRGGDIRQLGRTLSAAKVTTQGINSDMCEWQDIISCRWKLSGEHSNDLEARAYPLCVHWRLRRTSSIGTRYVHLVASMVAMNAMAKGRSSSQRLRKVLLRVNALILGGHLAPSLAYAHAPESG